MYQEPRPTFNLEATPPKPTLWAKLHNPFVLLAILFVIIVIAIIASIIYNYWLDGHDNKITVTNLDAYATNLPDDTRNDIYEVVFRAAQSNSPNLSAEELSRATATIRDNSFISSSNLATALYSGNFIADIPALKQSYRIYYDWTKNQQNSPTVLSSNSVSAVCLLPSEYIYPYYNCIGPYEDTSTAHLSYLNNILPYNTYTSTGVAIRAEELDYTTGGDPFVRIGVDACGDNRILQEGLNLIKTYISDHFLNPDDYTLKLTDLCDGEAS